MFDKENTQDKNYIIYTKAVSRGLLISIILILISAMLFYFTDLNENYMSSAVWIITILSICYSGIYGAFKIGHKGYIHGALLGAIYILILFIVAVLAERGQVNLKTYLIMFVMAIIIGGLSGMIGIVLKNK